MRGSEWLPHDLCADLRDDCDCGDRRHGDCDHRGFSGGPDCDCGHDRRDGHDCRDRRHRRRRRRAIPVGNVTVDCTPVTFRTPGQAINVVSCPVSRIVVPPHFPHIPCVKTVNQPPVQLPAPTIFFPPGFLPFGKFGKF